MSRGLTVLVALTLLAVPSFASDPNENKKIGFSQNHVFEGALQEENVDVMTGNVTLRIPIGPQYRLSSRFAYRLTLYYNSTIWEWECENPNSICHGRLTSPAHFGEGVQLHMGRVYQHPNDQDYIYRYQTPSGAEHKFCWQTSGTECEQSPQSAPTYTLDSAALHVTHISGGGWEIRPGDGTVVELTHQVDSQTGDDWDKVRAGNGYYTTKIRTIATDGAQEPQHEVNVEYDDLEPARLESVTDSIQRTITIDPKPGGDGWEIRVPTFSGGALNANAFATYTLDTSGTTIYDQATGLQSSSASFPPVTEIEGSKTQGVSHSGTGLGGPSATAHITTRLDAIRLPGLPTSESYEFFYDEGMSQYYQNGRLTSWTTPLGARMAYEYMLYGTGFNQPLHESMWAKTLTINEGDPEEETFSWTYTRFDGTARNIDEYIHTLLDPPHRNNLTNPTEVWVLDPLDNLTVYDYNAHLMGCGKETTCPKRWDAGMLNAIETYAGPHRTANALIKKELFEHTWDDGWIRTEKCAQGSHQNWCQTHELTGVAVPAATALRTRQSVHEVYTFGQSAQQAFTRTVSSDWDSLWRAKRQDTFKQTIPYRSTVTEWGTDPHFRSEFVHRDLLDAAGTVIRRTSAEFTEGRMTCSRTQPDSTAVTSCETDPLVAGHLQTLNTYHADTGELLTATLLGGDDLSEYRTEYTFHHGVPVLRTHGDVGAGTDIDWHSLDQSIDENTGLTVSYREQADSSSSGIETTYEFDELGRLEQIAPPLPETPIDISYPSLKETHVEQLDGSGAGSTLSKYFYDDLGRVVREERKAADGTMAFRETEFDILGRKLRESEWADEGTAPANLAWTTYEYDSIPNPDAGQSGEPDFWSDPLGRPSRVVRPDLSETTWVYDGLVTHQTVHGIEGESQSIDATTTFTNDDLGRLINVDAPAGASATYGYDIHDNLVQVDLDDSVDPVQSRYFVYDALGRLRTEAHPESGTTQYLEYDAAGRPVLVQDAKQQQVETEYDAAGRPVRRSVLAGGGTHDIARWVYDSDGTHTAPGQLVKEESLQFDGIGSFLTLTREMEYGSASAGCGLSLSGSHRGLNGRLAYERQRIEPWPAELETEFCYSPLGNLGLQRYPLELGDARTRSEVATAYLNGLPSAITDEDRNESYASAIEYNAAGLPTRFDRGDVIDEIDRDSQSRPSRIRLVEDPGCVPGPGCAVGATLWDTGDYLYDDAGNIKQIGSDTYRYDALQRLIFATADSNGHTLQYSYDGFGNMTQRRHKIGIAPYADRDLSVDAGTNRLLSRDDEGAVTSYTYDANGNMTLAGTHNYLFGVDNRLHEVWDENDGFVAAYDYDARGYRVHSVVGDIETFYFRDATGQLLTEYRRPADETGAPAWSKDYIYGLGQTLSIAKNIAPTTPGRPEPDSLAGTTVGLEWTEAEDWDLSKYLVTREHYVNGSLVFSKGFASTTNSYTDNYAALGTDPTLELRYSVKAQDQATNLSPESPQLIMRPYDGLAPSKPLLTSVIPGDGIVEIDWVAIEDNDLLHYEVWRLDELGGPAVIVGTHTETIFYDTTVTNGTGYRYYVKAVDSVYQKSVASVTLPLAPDWAEPRDNIPPGTPLGFAAFPMNDSSKVQLTWHANVEPDIKHYRIEYRIAGTGNWLPATGPQTSVSANHQVESLTPATTYEFKIEAEDTSDNVSGSVIVSATTRSDVLPTVTLTANCGWEIDYTCNDPAQQSHLCPYPTAKDSSDVSEELNDVVQVRLEWTFDSTAGRDGVRVYRGDAAGSTESWTLIAQIADPNVVEYLDTTPISWAHHYRVVTYSTVTESLYTQTATALVDDLPSDFNVRNIRATDGREYSGDERASMSLNYIEWSPSLEKQVTGYNLYRMCKWQDCGDGIVGQPSTNPALEDRHCVPSWVRLNDIPLTQTYFTDVLDGLPACHDYAVRPVSHDGTEGEVNKVLSVGTDPYEFLSSLHYDDEQFEQLPLETHTSLDLYGQLNDTQRGTGDPAGTPASPTNVEYSFHTAPPWMYRTTEISRYMAVAWDANSESDLRGYWIEFSYSDNGPWHRFTDRPLAWWETTYFKLAVHTRDHDGLESCPSSPVELPCGGQGQPACIYEDDCDDLDCLHVRVIAVDEAGNESLPAKPSDHPRAGCPTTAAPSAPIGLSAAYNGHVQPYPPDSECQTRLSWDDSGAESYEIHRLVWWDANSWFYKTGETAGTSCSGGTCHFDESGDHKENATLANTPCPLHINAGATFHANSCDPDFWQAFYVIAKDHTASGAPIRSAPSEIVWFNCPDAAASAMLWPQQSETEPLTLYAQAEVCEPASVEASFALLAADVATDAGDRAMPRVPEPALAAEWLSPPATLGQSSSNPPYRVFNVHVDHLGSTRRLTNPWGTVVEEHDFLPFGEEIAPVYSRGGKKFTGHERDDETGLDYMLARHYASELARFMSVDPVLGQFDRPMSFNRFVYSRNNPITYLDPDGRKDEYLNSRGARLAIGATRFAARHGDASVPGETGFAAYERPGTGDVVLVRKPRVRGGLDPQGPDSPLGALLTTRKGYKYVGGAHDHPGSGETIRASPGDVATTRRIPGNADSYIVANDSLARVPEGARGLPLGDKAEVLEGVDLDVFEREFVEAFADGTVSILEPPGVSSDVSGQLRCDSCHEE